MEGKKFGFWTVVRRAPPQGDNQGARWVCKCQCGVEKLVRAVYLRTGRSSSCGCDGKLDIDTNRARFMSKVKLDAATGCWLWVGGKARGGYGSFWYMGKRHRAHRAAYMIFVGALTDDDVVRHSCDTPGCVNPSHQTAGTQKDNIQDMLCKGRGRWQQR